MNGTATIQVSNPPPSAQAFSQTVSHGQPIDCQLRNSVYNPDQDPLTFELLDNLDNSHLSFSSDGHLHYDSTHFVPETLSIHYSVSDGVTTSPGIVNLYVVNNNPVISVPFLPIQLGHNALGGGRFWSQIVASDRDGDACRLK